MSWAGNNSPYYEYFALYRYNGNPLNPETRNISLFHNLKIFEFVDIPNIEHPYYMVRVYYANGTYADSNIVDVDLGEIPMFINPEYEIEGNTVSFSVWCKENVSIMYVYLLYRFRKEGDDWKCVEDMARERSPHAGSRSVMENNWTRYEWGPKEVKYSTYVWFNFYHEEKNVYWRPDRYANGTFNYEKWGKKIVLKEDQSIYIPVGVMHKMENPGRIEIEVDKKLYKSRDKAKLLVKSPFPGKLLLLVQREKVFDYQIVNMPENTATITIPIKSEYMPNVYVSATVIKSLDEYDGQTPLRAFGITPIMVDASGKKLGIEISSSEEIRPGKKLDLNIKIKFTCSFFRFKMNSMILCYHEKNAIKCQFLGVGVGVK